MIKGLLPVLIIKFNDKVPMELHTCWFKEMGDKRVIIKMLDDVGTMCIFSHGIDLMVMWGRITIILCCF